MSKKDGQASERQLEYFHELLREIAEGGASALVEQFCVWANTYVELIDAESDTARQVHAEQAFPVALILCGATGLEVEDVMDGMRDAVVPALFHAKLAGRKEIAPENAGRALTTLVEKLLALAEAH